HNRRSNVRSTRHNNSDNLDINTSQMACTDQCLSLEPPSAEPSAGASVSSLPTANTICSCQCYCSTLLDHSMLSLCQVCLVHLYHNELDCLQFLSSLFGELHTPSSIDKTPHHNGNQ